MPFEHAPQCRVGQRGKNVSKGGLPIKRSADIQRPAGSTRPGKVQQVRKRGYMPKDVAFHGR